LSIAAFDRITLLKKIKAREATVGIIGLGYVGLPLALAAIDKGFPVIGFDINRQRVEELNAGQSPLAHIPDASIDAARVARLFEATDDFARLSEADAIMICVPTPLGLYREPDLTYVERSMEMIAKSLRPGQLISLESTTYPGTTAEICRPILELSGLKSGRDFYLAFSAEREDPGNREFSTRSIPKVVGGDGPQALELALALYGAFVERVVSVSSLATAEAVKITENVFRAVNIALVNELKTIYLRMGIDIFEVIDAAKTKPFGFMAFYPGPGLGGHCIPIDPFYLTWKARAYGINTRFIELAGEINSAMPQWVVDRLAEALDRRVGRALSKARILVIGVAYKKNVSDLRESPALAAIQILKDRGAEVDYHDPYVRVIPQTRSHGDLTGMVSVDLLAATVSHYDAALIVTDHDEIEWQVLTEHAPLIVDTRNVLKRLGFVAEKIVAA
jgi:UDP-N-acetyl-D-glucosamine dehydrogenase